MTGTDVAWTNTELLPSCGTLGTVRVGANTLMSLLKDQRLNSLRHFRR